MKKDTLLLALLAAVCFLCFGCSENQSEIAATAPPGVAYPVEITAQHFPELLLQEQAAKADADGDGYLSLKEAQAVKTMHLKKLLEDADGLEDTPRPVYTAADFSFDLEGIQYFPFLKELTVNMLGGELFVAEKPEQILAVTKNFERVYTCKNLQKLTLSEVSISSIDLSQFPALKHLDLNSMYALEALEFPAEIKLTDLWLYDCSKITDLDLSGVAPLAAVNIVSNHSLSGIRFGSTNSNLKTLQLNDLPSLQQVDLTPLAALTDLNMMDVALKTLDVSKNAALEQLCAERLQLDTLDLRSNPKISYIINHGDSFQTILLADNNQVTMIRWTDSKITTFPVSNLNPDTLEGIDIQGTPIPELDVRAYPRLQHLYYDEDVTTIIR